MSASSPGHGRTILVVLHGQDPGGASLALMRVAPRLIERGWKPIFWCARPSPLFEAVRSRGLEVYGAPGAIHGYSLAALRVPPGVRERASRVPGYLRALVRLIRERQPAVVHCNSMYALHEGFLARALRVPVVFHVHEMVGDGIKHRLARQLLARTGDVVIGVSKAGAEALSTPSKPARVIFESCEIPAEQPHRPERERTIVGSVGVISPRKGTDVYVAAAQLVAEQTDEIEFHLVGAAADPLEAPWAERVLEQAAAAGVAHQVRADVPATMAGWDIFALPSRRDPFPIVVLEAMASGLPVVGTRVDGIAEQLTPATGVLVEPENAAELAAAVLRLHRDPRRRRTLGAAARERVRERFSLERQADALCAAYEAAARG